MYCRPWTACMCAHKQVRVCYTHVFRCTVCASVIACGVRNWRITYASRHCSASVYGRRMGRSSSDTSLPGSMPFETSTEVSTAPNARTASDCPTTHTVIRLALSSHIAARQHLGEHLHEAGKEDLVLRHRSIASWPSRTIILVCTTCARTRTPNQPCCISFVFAIRYSCIGTGSLSSIWSCSCQPFSSV